MYKVDNIAAFVIEYENTVGRHINYLRLCRYLYFIQAQFLVMDKKPCFDEKILAWDCGSMIESVGRDYRMFGNCSIYKAQNPVGYIALQDRQTIISMLDTMSKYSNTALAQIIFKQTPWMRAKTLWNKEITQISLYDFFREE